MASDNGVLRDLDDILDSRTFRLRGELLKIADIGPEEFFEKLDQVKEVAKESPTPIESYHVQDEQILAFLDPESHETYRALRARRENTPNMAQLNALLPWLWQVATGTPIEPASPSPAGAGSDAGSSEGA